MRSGFLSNPSTDARACWRDSTASVKRKNYLFESFECHGIHRQQITFPVFPIEFERFSCKSVGFLHELRAKNTFGFRVALAQVSCSTPCHRIGIAVSMGTPTGTRRPPASSINLFHERTRYAHENFNHSVIHFGRFSVLFVMHRCRCQSPRSGNRSCVKLRPGSTNLPSASSEKTSGFS